MFICYFSHWNTVRVESMSHQEWVLSLSIILSGICIICQLLLAEGTDSTPWASLWNSGKEPLNVHMLCIFLMLRTMLLMSLIVNLLQSSEYNKLEFFETGKDFWSPAHTTSDLYAQLSVNRYREIPRQGIMWAFVYNLHSCCFHSRL